MKRWGPHPFSLRQLQYALAVGETRSFRGAAERCRVAQPSLSAQLASLESALGVRLFERDRRRVLVTPAGEQLLARASALLREADDLFESAQQSRDPLAGTLRVGVIPTISPYLLPVVTPPLRSRFAKLRLVWIEDKTGTLRAALETGEIDAAILARESEVGDLEMEVIARDPFVIAAPFDDPVGLGPPARPTDLRQRAVFLLDDGHCFRDQALALCTDARAHEGDFRATSISTLAQMVAAGSGITLLPALAVSMETQRAKLAIRRFAEPAPHRTIVMAWRKRSPMHEALRAVAATIRYAYPRPTLERGRGARRTKV